MRRHEPDRRYGNGLKPDVRAWSLAALFAAAALVWGTSCLDRSADETQDCHLPALWILVVDGQTGEGVTDATVTATLGETVFALDKLPDDHNQIFLLWDSVYVGGDRVGQCTVHVEAPGYEPATTEVIQVPEGTQYDGGYLFGCRHAPVYWSVALTPSPE